MTARITIITAVYNRAAVIGQAIDTVAQQTYPNVEHLIIDGASTDGTLTVIEARRHPRMSVFSEPDKGIYDALNKGIARASGDIIGLLHSDDFFAQDTVLQKVADAFADPKIDAVYSDLDYVAADDTSRIIRHWTAGEFSSAKMRQGWMPPHPTLFLRAGVFERLGTYDTSYRISADYEAILRWFSKGRLQAGYIPEVLVKMRVGGESNKSMAKILRKSQEDYRALRANQIGGIFTLAMKNLSKIPQFFQK